MSKDTVRVRIKGGTAYLQSRYPYEKLLPYWSYSVPGIKYIPLYHASQAKLRQMREELGREPSRKEKAIAGIWDGRIRFLKRNALPASLFWATYQQITSDLKIHFKIKHKPVYLDVGQTRLLADKEHAFQNACVGKMLDAGPYGGGLILNATGSGKTYIAGLFSSAVRGHHVFIVDELHLLEQAKTELENVLGEKVGYVGNQQFKPKRITVATVQTMHKHRQDLRFQAWTDQIETIIIDEIHVQMGRRNFETVAAIKPKAVYGLTATLQLTQKPVRLKVWSIAGKTLFEYPLAKGMKTGVLSRGVVARVLLPNKVGYELRGVPWHEQYVQRIVQNPMRNHVIKRLVRYAIKKKMYVILLVERVKHLKKLSKLLSSVPHRLAFGERQVSERLQSARKFEKGTIRLIIANKVFKKGVNVKRVDVLVDAAALKNKNDAVQKFGRGIRKHIDKAGLLYFDIADDDDKNKKNRFMKAARSRKRAYKKAGIKVIDFHWEEDGEIVELFRQAQKALRRELKK
jgi:superfamily II DNA or RNA helicase